ncbi:hypothetical protein QUA56_24045 [Microcoleus sp. N3A4]
MHKYAYKGQSALWQDVKKSIKTRYSLTNISGDSQVVVVPFSGDMRFEVVPAFENTDSNFAYFLSPAAVGKSAIALSLDRVYGQQNRHAPRCNLLPIESPLSAQFPEVLGDAIAKSVGFVKNSSKQMQ